MDFWRYREWAERRRESASERRIDRLVCAFERLSRDEQIEFFDRAEDVMSPALPIDIFGWALMPKE